MKTIVVLMDSLNRHFLNVYNETWTKTPNIDRFAARSVVFDNHWLGSAPCMPARRDMLTGRLNFLETGWCGIQPFDVTLPAILRSADIFTHIVTDHYHYFEIGGENYCQQFNTWDLHRGQEIDPWVSRVNKPEKPEKFYGRIYEQYELNRTRFVNKEDFSGPRTFAAACEWLEANKDADNYLLWVEAFDPHEPFDCPDEYLKLYDDDYNGPRYDWPNYAPANEPGEAVAHIRRRYAACLTMIDECFGKLLDVCDRLNLWKDTLIIFTTDHGHMLGEHNYMGKNYMHMYNELAHIPLIMHLPESSRAGERVNALTQNIDLVPTILDYYNIEIPKNIHGHSLRGIVEGTEEKVRDTALYGSHGMTVNITDGKYTYFRAPSDDNYPCFIYTAMPTTLWGYVGRFMENQIETCRPFKHTSYPVFKIPVTQQSKKCNFTSFVKESLLFNIQDDYKQVRPIKDETIEKEMIYKLIDAMRASDAPIEQYERLGLTNYINHY